MVAVLLVVYTLVLYPSMPTFGLPCPATIFTICLMAFAMPTYPCSPPLMPVLWCLLGAQAFPLGVIQDLT